MADLDHRSQSRSRGQLILVTALALAAIFLGLAVIVNSAIFTENLATRNENVESTEALEYRHSVTQYMGEVVEFANEHNHSSHATIRDNVTDGTVDAELYTSIQQAEDGVGLSLSFSSYTDGARIFQNDGSTFENNESTTGDWDLATDIDNTRAFEFEITTPDDFRVVADNGSDTWTLNIDASAEEITVDSPSSSPVTCDYTTLESFDITAGTINESPCPALIDNRDGKSTRLADAFDDDYTIRFEQGTGIQGNYSLVIDNSSVSRIRDSDYAAVDGPGTGPYVRPAMYSARFDLEYQTQRVLYETEIVVAPGESP